MVESEREVRVRVAREHALHPHPGMAGTRLRLHLSVHVVVETQLSGGKPPEVGATLQRLMEQGLERHQAIHAVGQVAAEEVVACLSRGERYDEDRYVSRLRALSARDLHDEA